ncbi:MAG: hypothetical protein CMP05_11855 [Xanthomarina sp.]|uniref:hypothetical protein n=1 Tax=Flavobacteriaceae TaxID=49546 RepID=UPI000C62EC61|nr:MULTISPECIES: hypothetical protein [Flavobacteriaceae]MAL22154.1 hypothetical protein [Xanthomarina sp.]MBF62676.1 hypothetical protein [Xanthomarina sp.]|tara:strand:+ start:348 stop:599 length:252 start_codon:yes stop_codon:yes gene_type:complete
MNPKKWAELLRYSSPYSILVIKGRNKIIELQCPFEVELRHDIGVLIKGTVQSVEMVKLSTTMLTVFIIKGDAYYYYHFNILMK